MEVCVLKCKYTYTRGTGDNYQRRRLGFGIFLRSLETRAENFLIYFLFIIP